MHHSLGNIFRYANHVQAAHAGGQEHHRQHPVLRFTHRFGECEVVFDHAIVRGDGVVRRVCHQRRAENDHHQHDSAPDDKGFFQTDRRQQMGINKLETQAAKPVRTDRESRNQPLTFREPFDAVRQRQQIAGAVGKPDQKARAKPQHHQAV